jgi:small subunit ribosomal protein S12e
MAEDGEQMEVEEVAVEEIGVIEALEKVLKKAAIYDGLRRGLHESVKALDRGVARLCVLSKDCDNEEYKRLVQALCAESNVHLIMADSGTLLGQWVGLAKLNPDGTVRKAVRCSVAVVTDFGEENPYLNVVLNFVKSQQA